MHDSAKLMDDDWQLKVARLMILALSTAVVALFVMIVIREAPHRDKRLIGEPRPTATQSTNPPACLDVKTGPAGSRRLESRQAETRANAKKSADD